ncbi:MAG: hypothetical protein RLZZ628_606 [Bacteroidota bacterium]|jgi:hypothetical protein
MQKKLNVDSYPIKIQKPTKIVFQQIFVGFSVMIQNILILSVFCPQNFYHHRQNRNANNA